MARQNARSASDIRYDGTSTAEWSAPSLSEYVEAMGLEGVETTGDLTADQKRQIAAMTLMGEARASRFDELQSYPVVEPGGALNRNALEAARRLRGQSQDAAGIERVTRQLLNSEFDADIEQPDRMIPDSALRAAENGETLYRSYDVGIERGDGDDDPILLRFNAGQTTDRHGTRFDMGGAQLENYRSNNVLMWAHGKGQQGRVPIGQAIPRVVGDDLVAELDFDQEDDFARKIESKLRRGYLNAGSIGARPLARPELRTYGDEEVPTFPEWELTELSVVAVPSNPDALAMSRDHEEDGSLESRLARIEQQIGVAGGDTPQETRAISVDSLRRDVRQRVYEMDGPQESWYVKEVMVDSLTENGAEGSVIAWEQEAEQAFQMGYTYDGDTVILADRDDWTEVEQTWQPADGERSLKRELQTDCDCEERTVMRVSEAKKVVRQVQKRRRARRQETEKTIRQLTKQVLGKA